MPSFDLKNSPWRLLPKALAWLALGLAVLALLISLAAWTWLPSNRTLANQLEVRLSQAAGVPVVVGDLRWQLFPQPRLTLENLATQQPAPLKPLTVERLMLYPNLSDLLLKRRIQIHLAVLEGAAIDQMSLRKLGPATPQKKAELEKALESAAVSAQVDRLMRVSNEASRLIANSGSDGFSLAQVQENATGKPLADAQGISAETGFFSRLSLAETPLQRLEFSRVTWTPRSDIAAVYAGEVDFDPLWRPSALQVHRPDVEPPARLQATRQGGADRWKIQAAVGGGTADGDVQLLFGPEPGKKEPAKNSAEKNNAASAGISPSLLMRITGQVQPKGIEVASAMQAFNRKPVLSGKLSGSTRIAASGQGLQELAQSLRTQTAFTVQNPQLLGMDVEKAIRSLGKDTSGQTALQTLSGELVTQNSAKSGMAIELNQLQASASMLTASGSARLENRFFKAAFTVDLLSGLVGLPLKVEGPVGQLKVSVPASAVAGAAIGTVVLPGIGTAIGARIGTALEGIFGDKPASKAAPSKTAP